MVTRTFTKVMYTVKGLDNDDKVKYFKLEIWDFEAPKGKRAFEAMMKKECICRDLDFVRYIEDGTSSEVRGVSEADFFRISEHVER